ncbi:hypothetical protein D9757_006689 [Collybiopsis confluens]|uniref:F-box domain-containing protein n=1 Tax=Collybiopsis confluens TaxID=2823264 RepID=A0A8H5MA50_9AGAR|nr:hypothetical protein D9757_006689 [Collybiopsis confluens]
MTQPGVFLIYAESADLKKFSSSFPGPEPPYPPPAQMSNSNNPSSDSDLVSIDMNAIYEYLRSPYGIPEQRASETRQFLELINHRIARHQLGIAQLQTQLLFLSTELERDEADATRLRSVLSPVHRLPNEVLCRIFVWICHSKDSVTSRPFVLAGVCNRWRTLCLSYSRLWSKFHFGFHQNGLGSYDKWNLLDLFLQRSGQQSLTISIYYNESRPDFTLFHKFARCASRWGNIVVKSAHDEWLPMYLSEGVQFPALESLDIGLSGRDLETFENAPRLKKLTATSTLSLSQQVLQRIIDLSYTADAPNFRDVITSCPRLLTLSITGHRHDLLPENIPGIIVPTLTTLGIKGGGSALCQMLRFFTAPALTSLLVLVWHDVNILPHSDFDVTCSCIHAFLERSHCELKKLQLETDWSDSQLLVLLSKIPSLEELTVCELNYNIDIDDRRPNPPGLATKSFFEGLHSFKSSPFPLVPNLRSLTFKIRLRNFDDEAFVSMVLSRWIPVTAAGDAGYVKRKFTSLRSVDLSLAVPTDTTGRDMAALEVLKHIGIQFKCTVSQCKLSRK